MCAPQAAPSLGLSWEYGARVCERVVAHVGERHVAHAEVVQLAHDGDGVAQLVTSAIVNCSIRLRGLICIAEIHPSIPMRLAILLLFQALWISAVDVASWNVCVIRREFEEKGG